MAQVADAGTSSAVQSAEVKDLKDLLEAMSKRLERIEERRKRKPKSEIECFGCGVKGHYKSECPTAPTPKAKGKPSLNE